MRGPEDFASHVNSCAVCRGARTSEDYCAQMQAFLGPSSGQLKNAGEYSDTARTAASKDTENRVIELLDWQNSAVKEEQP